MKKALIAALSLCMAICLIPAMSFANDGGGNEVEPNDEKSSATVVEPGVFYDGVIDLNDYDCEDDYYTLTIQENGYFTVDFQMPAEVEADNINTPPNVEVFVQGKTDSIDEFDTEDSITSNKYSAVKGKKVYVKVSSFALFEGEEAPYSIRINTVADSTWETEFNDTKGTADVMSAVGKYYKGNLYGSDSGFGIITEDVDYWKFTAPSTGKYRFSFEKGSEDYEDDDIKGGWKVDLYLKGGTQSKHKMYNTGDTTSAKQYLRKGQIVYIKVDSYGNPNYVDYRLKATKL